jgi:biofilm PGA synthesis N-glycosyltransferase PgaC
LEIKKYRSYIWLAVVIIGLTTVLAFSYQSVREQQGSFSLLLESYVLTAVTVYLLIFLALLIFRYALLILYSFMDHLESVSGKRDKSDNLYRDDSSLPMISLVVPAYNEGLVIQAAIRSLLLLDYPNYEIIVIDDGSTDDTYEKALGVAQEQQAITVRVITKRNGGKAEALNTGMTAARGEFVLNMDGDSKLSSNTLRACIRHFENPKIGAVAGNVKVINRENIWSKIQGHGTQGPKFHSGSQHHPGAAGHVSKNRAAASGRLRPRYLR